MSGMTDADGWWHPDPEDPNKGPDWPPVDLEKSGLSQLTEIRPDRSMRRHHHPGSMTADFGDGRVVSVPEGSAKYVAVQLDWDLVIR